MQHHVLAVDYDGTLAENSYVDPATVEALQRLKKSGRKIIIVTGRLLESLLEAFPQSAICDLIVAENGALLYNPETGEERTLAEPPPRSFDEKLGERGVPVQDVGRVIRATHVPYETVTLEVIRDLALELQIVFNKGAVMVLPTGVNKATGLAHALEELGYSPHNSVGAGDAENDEAMLRLVGTSAAVANALAPLKERATIVLNGAAGQGIVELAEKLLSDDLSEVTGLPERGFKLGHDAQDEPVWVPAYGPRVFITGESTGGKSKLAVSILDQLIAAKYQVCVFDPDGDYQSPNNAIVLGDREQLASPDEVKQVVSKPGASCVVSLFAAEADDQPEAFQKYHRMLQEHRLHTGRPHFTIIDEAHYPLPANSSLVDDLHLEDWRSVLYVTAFPDRMPTYILDSIDLFVGVGKALRDVLAGYCELIDTPCPTVDFPANPDNEWAVAWWKGRGEPFLFRPLMERGQHQRHRHQYFDGEMDADMCFYFRGPEGQLNLAAGNLRTFMQLARGVDDDTWLFHLGRGDYTRWFRDIIRDPQLAHAASQLEQADNLTARSSRERLDTLINDLYGHGH